MTFHLSYPIVYLILLLYNGSSQMGCRFMQALKPVLVVVYSGVWLIACGNNQKGKDNEIRYFSLSGTHMNDCTMLWSGIYRQSWENVPHNHVFFQIVGILNGCAMLSINNRDYLAEQGQLFLFKPQELHSITYDSDYGPLKVMDIKFSVSDNVLYQNLLAKDNSFSVPDFHYLKSIFNKIIDESTQCRPYYYTLINCYLYEILAYILRDDVYSPKVPVMPLLSLQQKAAVWKGISLEELLQYINVNYSGTITLDDLSKVANINKTTLIDIFKDLYNTTPIHYINELRLQKAKDLLASTDINITEIASLVGFQSLHNFCRHFKAKERKTPNEYRTLHKYNSYFTY